MKKLITSVLLLTSTIFFLNSCEKVSSPPIPEEPIQTDPFLIQLQNKKWQLTRYQVDSLLYTQNWTEILVEIVDTSFNYGSDTYTMFKNEDYYIYGLYLGKKYINTGSQNTPISYSIGYYNVTEDSLGNKGLWLNNSKVYWIETLTADSLVFRNNDMDTEHKYWKFSFVCID